MPKKTYEEQMNAYEKQMEEIKRKKSELKRKRQQKIYKKAYDVLMKSSNLGCYEFTDDLLFKSTVDEIDKYMNDVDEKVRKEWAEQQARIKQQGT